MNWNVVGNIKGGESKSTPQAGLFGTLPRSRVTTIDSCDSAWDDFYVGGEGSIDSVEHVRGTGSLCITATSAGTYGCSREVTSVSITGSPLRFYVRCSDWTAVTAVTLLLASDSYSLSNTLTVDIGTRLVNAPSNEWIEIVAPVSGLLSDGIPDSSAIDLLLVKVVANNTVQFWIDDIAKIPSGTNGLVTITFDDGYDDVYKIAKPLLDSYGWEATAYIAPEKINDVNFMTEEQVVKLSRAGWDIGGHALVNLTSLTASARDKMLADCKNWLSERGLNGAEHFALPNGAYNDAVLMDVGRYFATATNIDGWNNATKYVPAQRINRQSIDRWTTPAMIEGWVQDAITNGEWCILNFHTLVDTLEDGQDFLTSDFAAVLAMLAGTGVQVVPISQAIRVLSLGTSETPRWGEIDGNIGDQHDLTNALATASGGSPSITIASSTTLTTEHLNHWLWFDSATPITITIPKDLPAPNAQIEGMVVGAGNVTFTADAGVTLDKHAKDTLVSDGKGSVIGIRNLSPNVWWLFGRLGVA